MKRVLFVLLVAGIAIGSVFRWRHNNFPLAIAIVAGSVLVLAVAIAVERQFRKRSLRGKLGDPRPGDCHQVMITTQRTPFQQEVADIERNARDCLDGFWAIISFRKTNFHVLRKAERDLHMHSTLKYRVKLSMVESPGKWWSKRNVGVDIALPTNPSPTVGGLLLDARLWLERKLGRIR